MTELLTPNHPVMNFGSTDEVEKKARMVVDSEEVRMIRGRAIAMKGGAMASWKMSQVSWLSDNSGIKMLLSSARTCCDVKIIIYYLLFIILLIFYVKWIFVNYINLEALSW